VASAGAKPAVDNRVAGRKRSGADRSGASSTLMLSPAAASCISFIDTRATRLSISMSL
jgi:hypothetical protein